MKRKTADTETTITTTAKRRWPVKRRWVPRPLTGINIGRHFKRIVNHGTINTSSVSGAAGAFAYKLSDLPGASEFTTLFDQYRIKFVECHFIPDNNVAFLTATGDTMPRALLLTVPDYDDDTAPTLSSMFEREGTQFVPVRQQHVRRFVPRCQTAAWQTGGATGVAVMPRNQWLDVGSPSIPHYGIKYYLEALNASTAPGTISYRCMSYVTVELKGVR